MPLSSLAGAISGKVARGLDIWQAAERPIFRIERGCNAERMHGVQWHGEVLM